jgi:hypothetical protein
MNQPAACPFAKQKYINNPLILGTIPVMRLTIAKAKTALMG